MPREDYTHLVFVVDRSGSMSGIASTMCEGYNGLMVDQREVDGKATVTLAQFDDRYELLYDMVDIETVPELTLQPRGCTALLDAMGRTMNTVLEQIMEMEESERPARCLFVTITDGGENSSMEYTRDRIFQMIQDCQERDDINFDFTFLGANQDAIAVGGGLGIRQDAALTYAANNVSAQAMCDTLSRSMTQYRCCKSRDASLSYSLEDRENVLGENPLVPDIDSDVIKNFKK